MLRLRHFAASALALAACADQPGPSSLAGPAPAPLLSAGPADQSLQDRYIVVFKPSVRDVDAAVDQLVRENGIVQVHYRYRAALQGFAATLPAQALEGVRRNPNVEFVEADGLATIDAGTQNNPPSWGLDRIDERDISVENVYNYENEGQNVEAYILDTGIRYTHQEYRGRAFSGWDFVDNDADAQDCHGHGTHVAGTVGGTGTGVAKLVKLYGVRVLNCSGSGSYSGIVAAVDWVTQRRQATNAPPMVGNMSLGGGFSSALNTAVNNSVAARVVWAVAAGNDTGADACNKSPASATGALTVGASGSNDARASFSNIGTCLDLFAPGVSITSSTYNADNTYAAWSGTSMATPHVAGVAALYLSGHLTATASEVNTAITSGATPNKITDPGLNSPNRLLYSLIAGATVDPPSPPPSGATSVGLASISGTGLGNGKKNWKAQITVTVKDDKGALIPSATVSGSFTTGGSGSCLTGANGTCTLTSGAISRSVSSTTWTLTGIAATLTWDGTITTVTVNNPF